MDMLPRTCEKWGDQEDGTYINPILNSDFSDPDVIRVGNRYYMITSTFHFHPGMQILESDDLVNWRIINYAIPNLDELDEGMSWKHMSRYGLGVYAGSIRFLQWKEKMEDGSYAEKHRWFIYTTLYKTGIIVATAEDVYGQWTCTYMKDRYGRPVCAPGWDDNCPYWEKNADGTLARAYMVASMPGGSWYLHVFKMSIDGMQLLDGDVRYMRLPFDTVRKRTGETIDSLLFAPEGDMGAPDGKIIDRRTGIPMESSREWPDAHVAVMNAYGDILSTTNAIQIPNREGTIISDIHTVEASKIIRFGEDTEIGKTIFTGRHGANQRIADYIYIFSSEYWDRIRIPLVRRAKCIYGDRYDDTGRYIGPGTSEEVGVFETQRICVNTTVPYDQRQPNQGGYVDVPA